MHRTRHWALNSWDRALQAYGNNYPKTKLIHADAGSFLQRAVEGQESKYGILCSPEAAQEAGAIRRNLMPKLGEVDLIIAGPPCQVGFVLTSDVPAM